MFTKLRSPTSSPAATLAQGVAQVLPVFNIPNGLIRLFVVLIMRSYTNYGRLKLHPVWAPLRGDPRFEKIVNSLAPK